MPSWLFKFGFRIEWCLLIEKRLISSQYDAGFPLFPDLYVAVPINFTGKAEGRIAHILTLGNRALNLSRFSELLAF